MRKIYEFHYYETVTGESGDIQLDSLFDTFMLLGEITGEELMSIQKLKITVVGRAIQTAGFTDENAAWAAFEEQALPVTP